MANPTAKIVGEVEQFISREELHIVRNMKGLNRIVCGIFMGSAEMILVLISRMKKAFNVSINGIWLNLRLWHISSKT